MTLSDISVRRPVLAAVASLLLLVFGLAAVRAIPVRELPDVDNAVVTVTTNYRGAAPEVIDTDITETIEGSIAAINGIRSISSESRQGRSGERRARRGRQRARTTARRGRRAARRQK